MREIEKWIWLPKEQYPNNQTTIFSGFLDHKDGNYTVAEFQKTYTFEKKIQSALLRFSGDTEFQLYVNGEILATGPACVGGDFLGNEKVRPNFYASELEMMPDGNTLDFFARVKMMPYKICEYSKGHGGFMLTAWVTFEDGTKTVLTTDETWKVRKNGAYVAPSVYDGRILPDACQNAEEIVNLWHTETAPIPVRTEENILPLAGKRISLAPHEEKSVIAEFDRIYAGYVCLRAKTDGELHIQVNCREIDENGSQENVILTADGEYRGFILHSAGNYKLELKNDSDSDSELEAALIATCYPVEKTALTRTSDEQLNQVLDVCRHTLKYCRQTHHLDSPRHCEPLACTGDYYIETLMTAFSFGDMGLAEFDIRRTAELLRNNDGRMFHTTYSLIWVKMLYDTYLLTGNYQLLCDAEDALILLLNRFATYIGENGLIETPPDFMFVDWIYIDGLSMHHPPKALGQTCLNMYYFGALEAGAKIYQELGEEAMAQDCLKKREVLGGAIRTQLFDAEKGLFFEGLNTPTPEEMLYNWLPQNVEKRYYLKQSNILAAYVGVCDRETTCAIIDKIMSEECPGDYQPYFAHFLLEGIYKNGLRDKYTREVLERWKAPVKECPKGLVEGFIAPEPTYGFDHSHAWGGTPLYSLPKALMGLEILEPGMKKLRLNPSLMGLTEARVELPTPYGDVILEMEEGKEPKITHPEEVCVI